MYRIFISEYARRQIKRIDHQYHAQIANAISSLSKNPRPFGAIKLTNRDAYRIRSGDFRIIYEIHDTLIRVLIVAVGHRKDIYY
jgi:mRNA interferase RelE/StbE